jgi:adenosine deaminase
MCPTSNVHTGAVPSLAEHPIGLLRRLRFRVTVSTDNRLMSGISLSSEMADLVEAFDWSWRDINWLTINAMKSAFCSFEDRLALIDGKIKPGFAALDPDSPAKAPAGSLPTQGSSDDYRLID